MYVLGIVLENPTAESAGVSPFVESFSRSDAWECKVTPSASNLDLSHVPQDYRNPVRTILLQYKIVRDVRLV